MAKKLVSELSGAELDYWIGCANGLQPELKILHGHCYRNCLIKYSPSTSPAQGWPIIERDKINTAFYRNEWHANNSTNILAYGSGETGLIAAMRCYVASVYGEYVDG